MWARRTREWGAALLVMVMFCFTVNAFGQATLISPQPGTVLPSPSVMFTWAGAAGASEYDLWLGVSGPGSSNLYASGWSTAMSTTVPSLPAKGATVYARLFSKVDGKVEYNDYTFTEATSIPSALISPAAGSVLGVSGQTFTWTAGADVAEYQLWLGLSGPGSSSLYTSGWLTTASTIVPSLPAKGATVYARLFSQGPGGLQYNDYVFDEAGAVLLSSLSCTSVSITGSGTDACALTLNAAAPASGLAVNLSSSSAAASVPSSVMVPANATSAGFMTTVSAVTTPQPVTLTAVGGGVSQTVVLELNANMPTLSVATSASPSTYGGAVTLTATISNGPTGVVTFYDGGAAIGAGSLNGTTATFTTSSLSAGSHSITAAWAGNSTYCAATSGAVPQVVTKATPSINWNAPPAILYGTALSGAQLDASSAVAGLFAYSPAAGTILDSGVQTLSVTFTPTDTVDYNTATASVQVTVNKATPSIAWAAPAAITFGTALGGSQLNASASVAGSFAYSPAAGTVPAAGLQTLSVTFTPTNSTDYAGVSASVSLTVSTATPVISWAAPGAIAYGTVLSVAQLDATASVPGTFAYSPAAGTVLGAGAQTLAVTFTPTDAFDYTSATAIVALTVNTTTPTINWAAPSAIAYGTALTSTQLNATASVPGSFSYSPAAGTVLTSGAQTLSVTFTPTDATDYNTATGTVALTVNKTTPTITWAAPSSIAYGTALGASQLNATASVPGTFTYMPAAGTVLTSGAQTLSVTFTPTDATDYSTATGTVALTVNKATPTVAWATPTAIGFGTALNSTQLNATSTVAGTFVYSPAAGTILPAGSQTLSVAFNPTDSADYNNATATVTLTVNKAMPTITWAAPAGISYGTALTAAQLDASSIVPGTFVYSPAAGTVLTAGSQTLSVTFTPTDTTNFSTAGATVTLTVGKATPAIIWPTPGAFISGTALSSTQLDATASVAGSFAYSPALGTVLAAGSQTLTVTFTPTDSNDYSTATGSVTLTVNQAVPTLSINASSVAFGSVNFGQPATQTLTLTSTGNVSVTVNSATVAGTGFTLSGATLPVTLAPGQTSTLGVEFNPTVTGAATGTLTVSSTSSTNGTATVALTGTGTATSYQVNLSWDAPASSPDPVAGYNVYRAPSGSTLYQLVNPSVESLTAYVDTTVVAGSSYDYIVESVDASGVASVPTSPVLVTIP